MMGSKINLCTRLPDPLHYSTVASLKVICGAGLYFCPVIFPLIISLVNYSSSISLVIVSLYVLLSEPLRVGDWVSISTECGIYCVSQGFVTRVETCFGVNTRSQQRHAGGYEGMAVCVSVRSREPIQLARVQLQNREEKENGEAVQSIADIEDCFLSDGGKNPFVGQLKRFRYLVLSSWCTDMQVYDRTPVSGFVWVSTGCWVCVRTAQW